MCDGCNSIDECGHGEIFYRLCYDQYVASMGQWRWLAQASTVVLLILCGLITWTWNAIFDPVGGCKEVYGVSGDITFVVLACIALLSGAIGVGKVVVCLLWSRKYIEIADTAKLLKWRKEHMTWQAANPDRHEAGVVEGLCVKLADAQAWNNAQNEGRRQALKIAATCALVTAAAAGGMCAGM